jgi:hypothetical protein
MGETKIITVKIEVMCVHTETDKYDSVNWQALLAYTATGMLIERSPLSISDSDFYFLRTRGV